MMKRLKEYLQKRKSSWPALALTAAVLLFCLVIALQAGRIGSMFHPESFLSREERKEEFDPKGYGLEEDGEKQKEEDDRQDDTFEQEQTGQRTESCKGGLGTVISRAEERIRALADETGRSNSVEGA